MKRNKIVMIAAVTMVVISALSLAGCPGSIGDIFGNAEFLLLQNGSPVSSTVPFDFGEVTLDSTSGEVSFFIRNDGVANLNLLTGVSISGSGADPDVSRRI